MRMIRYLGITKFVVVSLFILFSQMLNAEDPTASPSDEESQNLIENKVDVEVVTDDQKIENRLRQILEATGWFRLVEIEVKEGIVFINGEADTPDHKEWAAQLAKKTQGVVAVVNRLVVMRPNILDFTPAFSEIRNFVEEFIRNIPLMVAGITLLVGTWFVSRGVKCLVSKSLKMKIKSSLLRNIVAKSCAVIIFLFGLYLVLRVSGLTRLALTIIGSTGLLGLVIGFAFRDIAENFLASVLISIQHPFAKGDLILVSGYEGYVQNVNTRSTVLITRDGNFIQIPNGVIYKEPITNYTANPNTRFEFTVGIGYDDSIEEAQTIALEVAKRHEGVVDDPPPVILVDELGAATVNLRVTFWVNIAKHNQLKVRSSLIRKVKKAFEEEGISMPDEARELIFPEGVPVKMVDEEIPLKEKKNKKPQAKEPQATEGNLESEAMEIKEQAEQAREPEGETDLLE